MQVTLGLAPERLKPQTTMLSRLYLYGPFGNRHSGEGRVILTFDLVAWLRQSALPLWSDVGVDKASGMFVERLDLNGAPLSEVPRRLMVQARQIFVFAEAHARGWYSGGELAERAGEMMVRSFFRDDAGWIFSVTPEGRPVDETRDLCAHAFVLFALASLNRLTGSDHWLKLAEETIGFLDANLSTPATGGYAESVPAKPGPRRQNPHMHLLEALIALDEQSPGGTYRRRAGQIIDLFETRFLHGSSPVLVELYDDDLRPTVKPPFCFEPGHHFEWAWLLTREAALAERPRSSAIADHLCDVAHLFGRTKDQVFFDEVDGSGHALVRSTRLWPCTEAIRATASRLGHARQSLTSLQALVEAMQRRFLAGAPDGCWIDHLGADDRPLSQYVPASSLYHIVGAAIAIADVGSA